MYNPDLDQKEAAAQQNVRQARAGLTSQNFNPADLAGSLDPAAERRRYNDIINGAVGPAVKPPSVGALLDREIANAEAKLETLRRAKTMLDLCNGAELTLEHLETAGIIQVRGR